MAGTDDMGGLVDVCNVVGGTLGAVACMIVTVAGSPGTDAGPFLDVVIISVGVVGVTSSLSLPMSRSIVARMVLMAVVLGDFEETGSGRGAPTRPVSSMTSTVSMVSVCLGRMGGLSAPLLRARYAREEGKA